MSTTIGSKKKVISRRLLLRGAGGVAVGLPFLPSLQSRALAAEPAFARNARFVSLSTGHGAVLETNMFPAAAMASHRTTLHPGHEAGWGPLVRQVEGTEAMLSPVLRAPAAAFTERLVAKMNVLRGLDVPFYLGHHTGGHLGNFARNDGNGAEGKEISQHPMPTIDQIMAWSPSFYRDVAGVRERVIVTGSRGGISYNWSNPAARSGPVQEIKPETSSLALFNRIFVPEPTAGVPVRKPIVDRILEDYKSLRNGSRRLSTADKQRLDDHLARIAELERRLTAPVNRPLSCKAVGKPAEEARGISDRKKKYTLYNDVIVAAFLCGSSRLAVMSCDDVFVSFSGSWHQDVAHQWSNPTAAQLLADSNRNFFEWVFLDLMTKLDVEESPGVTFLDNTLIAWTQESGQQTHDPVGIPVVTAGSAGGFLKTGLTCDYRNLTMKFPYGNKNFELFHGLTWYRWLGTVLQAMGLPRSEYERPGVGGYGHFYVSNSYRPKYVSGVHEAASEVLPFIKA